MKKYCINKSVFLLGAIFLYLCLSSFQCKKGMGGFDLRMQVKNNSSQTIYYSFSNSYPDLAISPYMISYAPEHFKLGPGEKFPIYLGDSWSHYVTEIPDQKLIFFFFDAQVLESTNWDTIRKNNMYLDRKILTLDSIKKMNWPVSYP